MHVIVGSDRRLSGGAVILVLVLAAGLLAIVSAGCGEASGSGGGDSAAVVETEGTIGPDDTRDPDHADLPYDAYTFEATQGDAVVAEVGADGFVPLLKLVEVATGAPLAEWEAEYSDDDALTYTIAGPGTYEVRVYALEDGRGTYTLTVRVNP
jgi:hypothetical protein